jgi:hypothetical protein
VKAILLLVGEKRRTYRMEAEILHVSRLQSCFGRFYSTSLKIPKKVSLSNSPSGAEIVHKVVQDFVGVI